MLHRPLASPNNVAGGFSTVPTADYPGWLVPFEGPLDWRCLLPGICLFFGWIVPPRQPVHHWRLSYCNRV